ncbi:ATP-binding protein [Shimazuella kribbensis]|uniref:AAA family ATPase n=1 Tax=Shimazuella kribbensis TaxID=139808 RepID=UPI001FE1F609
MGPPGSGKSTHAQKTWNTIEIINADTMMVSFIRVKKLLCQPSFTKRIYPIFEKRARNKLKKAIKHGKPFVLDDTSIDFDWTEFAMKKAKKAGYRVLLIYVCASLETCLTRNKQRDRFVDPERVQEIYHKKEKVWSILSKSAHLSMTIDTNSTMPGHK